MTVFWGTLYSSIKKIEAPDVFDLENAIDLHAMQGNRASFVARGKSHGFSRFAERQARWVYSRIMTGMPIINRTLFSEVRTLV